MPKTWRQLKGLEISPKDLEKIKRARRKAYEWQKKQEEKQSFNSDQRRAQELNPT